MKVFAESRINLVKLESRPIHGKPWQYMFYADIEGRCHGAGNGSPFGTDHRRKTDFLRILGATEYRPRGNRPTRSEGHGSRLISEMPTAVVPR
jgi:prephenate dehydratase